MMPKAWNHDKFLDEVERRVGDEYTVLSEYVNNYTKVWLRHESCGWEYQVRPVGFIHRNNRCPKCAEKTKHLSKKMPHEEFVKLVEELGEGEYTVIGTYNNSRTKVELLHKTCGRSWEVTSNRFIHGGVRCPKCRESRGERRVREVLDREGLDYVKEFSFKDSGISRMRYDFFVKDLNLLIEYDGIHHFKPVPNFGGESNLEGVRERDELKDSEALDRGYSILRISYQAFDDIDRQVTASIARAKRRAKGGDDRYGEQ